MRVHRSIRRRIILILATTLALGGLLLGAVLLAVYRHLEADTFGHMVHEHLQLLLQQPHSQFPAGSGLLSRWQVFRATNLADLPDSLNRLGPGSHHSVRIGEHRYQVEIAQKNNEAIALAYQITEWEQQEHTLFLVVVLAVVAIIVLALLLGSRVAGAILVPIHRLTARLAEIQPGQPVHPFSAEFAHSELAPIADSLDRYLRRLDQFVEREQSFSAAASHELRTPLSVIVGALDVIESNSSAAAASRATERIRRACNEMVGFIDATLFLAREAALPRDTEGTADVAEVIRALVDDHGPMLQAAGVEPVLRLEQTPLHDVPVSLLQIAVGNLLKNVAEHSAGTRVEMILSERRLSVIDNGCGIAAADLPHVFERNFTTGGRGNGMGLSLLRRIADRFGWRLEVSSEAGAGTRVQIDFPAYSA